MLANSEAWREIQADSATYPFCLRLRVLAVCLASPLSLTGILFGGGALTDLANSGNVTASYVSAPELAAANWVNNAAPPGQLIYADRYGALRLNIVAGTRLGVMAISLLSDYRHAWVYADRTNDIDGITRSSGGTYAATYAFPNRFLDSNFDVVYNSGTSEVFHR